MMTMTIAHPVPPVPGLSRQIHHPNSGHRLPFPTSAHHAGLSPMLLAPMTTMMTTMAGTMTTNALEQVEQIAGTTTTNALEQVEQVEQIAVTTTTNSLEHHHRRYPYRHWVGHHQPPPSSFQLR